MVNMPKATPRTRLLLKHRKYLDRVLNRSGPYADPDWMPGYDTINSLESAKVLSVVFLKHV
jgi:hypothetical protein